MKARLLTALLPAKTRKAAVAPAVATLGLSLGLAFSGCVSTNQRASGPLLRSLGTIGVVAVEAPPIFVHPAGVTDRLALDAAGVKAPPSAADPWALRLNLPYTPGFIVGAAIDISSYGRASTPRAGETLTMTNDEPSTWMPTVYLAARAAQQLEESGHRSAFVLEGYARLSAIDRTKDVPLADWLAVVRRWFNSDQAMLDQAALTKPSDAILQVGVLNYEYSDERLVLQVMVKLVDRESGRVVARAREHSVFMGKSVAMMMRDGGSPLRDLVDSSGSTLIERCLQDLGIAGPPASHESPALSNRP